MLSMQLQKRRYNESRWGRRVKPTLAQTISTDRLVACPSCGGPMHLSETHVFECAECGRAVTGEEALTIYDVDSK
jgi:DNA-directed RNA polymerase subunit RPC12/RpoP